MTDAYEKITRLNCGVLEQKLEFDAARVDALRKRERPDVDHERASLLAQVEALRSRLVTIVDEACGLQPVDTSSEDLFTLLEKDHHDWRMRASAAANESLRLSELFTAATSRAEAAEARVRELEYGNAEAFVNLDARERAGEILAAHQLEWLTAERKRMKVAPPSPPGDAVAAERPIVVEAHWARLGEGSVRVTAVSANHVAYQWDSGVTGLETIEEFRSLFEHVSDPEPPAAVAGASEMDQHCLGDERGDE